MVSSHLYISIPRTPPFHHHQSFSFFFFNDTATTEIYTLSLHDALPISCPTSAPCKRWYRPAPSARPSPARPRPAMAAGRLIRCAYGCRDQHSGFSIQGKRMRSEEHTSELQSLTNLVCRLLLEKKKKRNA